MSYLGSYFGCSDSPPEGSCFTLTIELNSDPKFRSVDTAEGKWCANTGGYGISGKNDDFTHGVKHPCLTTEEGGWCLQRALFATQSDAEHGGVEGSGPDANVRLWGLTTFTLLGST